MSNSGKPRLCSAESIRKQREILEVVCSYPGATLIGVAKLMDKTRTYVLNHTTSMDLSGILLSEDEDGGLYLFRVISHQDALELQQQLWVWGWNAKTYE